MICTLLKFIILPGRDFNSYTNHQSLNLWRGDFFSAKRVFSLDNIKANTRAVQEVRAVKERDNHSGMGQFIKDFDYVVKNVYVML